MWRVTWRAIHAGKRAKRRAASRRAAQISNTFGISVRVWDAV